MIRNSMLTLTSAVRREHVRVGENFTINLPGGEQFSTRLIDASNRLQDRKHIRMLFEQGDVQSGDLIVLSEQPGGEWHAKVENRGRPNALDAYLGI